MTQNIKLSQLLHEDEMFIVTFWYLVTARDTTAPLQTRIESGRTRGCDMLPTWKIYTESSPPRPPGEHSNITTKSEPSGD